MSKFSHDAAADVDATANTARAMTISQGFLQKQSRLEMNREIFCLFSVLQMRRDKRIIFHNTPLKCMLQHIISTVSLRLFQLRVTTYVFFEK